MEEKLIERLEEEKSDWNCDYNVPINKAIEIVKDLASEHNNDFCEWKFVKSVSDGGYFYSSGCSHKRFSDLHSFEFCPYCGKEIKIIPAPYKKGE
jgi:hypothetical protein